MIVHACVAPAVAGFEPSSVDHNWLEIDSGRNGNQSIADTDNGTASVLGYGLDAAGESPTAVSVTQL